MRWSLPETDCIPLRNFAYSFATFAVPAEGFPGKVDREIFALRAHCGRDARAPSKNAQVDPSAFLSP